MNIIICVIASAMVSFMVANIYIKKCYTALEESLQEYARQVMEIVIQETKTVKRS